MNIEESEEKISDLFAIMHRKTSITKELSQLLLKIIRDNILFIRQLSNNVFKDEQHPLIYKLADSIHNIPNALANNNLNDCASDISVYIQLYDYICYSKVREEDVLFSNFFIDYKKNRNKIIKLLNANYIK